MGKFIAEKTVKQLIAHDRPVKGAKVLILGWTLKEDVPDIRNLPTASGVIPQSAIENRDSKTENSAPSGISGRWSVLRRLSSGVCSPLLAKSSALCLLSSGPPVLRPLASGISSLTIHRSSAVQSSSVLQLRTQPRPSGHLG